MRCLNLGGARASKGLPVSMQLGRQSAVLSNLTVHPANPCLPQLSSRRSRRSTNLSEMPDPLEPRPIQLMPGHTGRGRLKQVSGTMRR